MAARLGSFSEAARLLNVTQSAVSRQIGTLERYLGTKLFHRERRGVRLTEAGQTYSDAIAPAFDTIASATLNLGERGRASPLRVQVYTTFAAKWLIPRLPAFRLLHPTINIGLTTAVAPVDFGRDSVDCAIQLGSGEWRRANSILLFPDLIEPVCAPGLMASAATALDDLGRYPLLHSHYRRADWGDWLKAVGRPEIETSGGMTFDSSILTYRAAEDGLGIAIGQINILEAELKSGSLVRPFKHPIERGLAYYALWPTDREPDRRLRQFLDWLEKEASRIASLGRHR